MELLMKQMLKVLPILFALSFFIPHVAMARDYPTIVGEKVATGFTNAITGVGEIPKTIMVMSHEKGPVYGATVGFMVGLGHTLGRSLCGALDLATFMIPTESIVKPNYIWDHFDRETSYSSTFKMR